VIGLDYETDKLFWVDAKLHMICSSNLDGSEQTIVLMSREHLKHPFSVAVFEVGRFSSVDCHFSQLIGSALGAFVPLQLSWHCFSCCVKMSFQ